MQLLETLFEHGGVAMYAIAFGSVLSVALGLERWAFLRSWKKQTRGLHEETLRLVSQGALEEARSKAQSVRSPAAGVYVAALTASMQGREPAGPADRARRRAGAALRSGLWLQGTLGATMPFIGLFGTVVGVLEAFEQISQAGTSGFAVVAGAIAEALITTAGGIAVAVEAVILFNIFGALATAAALELSLDTEELVETLRHRQAPSKEAA